MRSPAEAAEASLLERHGDTTNYDMYVRLAQCGLAQRQMIAIAHIENLHELRTLRMLRLTYGLSLSEAKTILSKDGNLA